MSSVLPFTDIVFGNETEAAAYAESFELNTSDIGEIAMKIAQLPKAICSTKIFLNTYSVLPVIVNLLLMQIFTLIDFLKSLDRRMAAEADWW